MKYKSTIFSVITIAWYLTYFFSAENNKTITNAETYPMWQDTNHLFLKDGLTTNTAKATIPLNEILNGGPSKDGIPALSNPKFVISSRVKRLPETTMGILVQNGSEKKFYPYTILVWHEIVNDVIGKIPIAITFCPLCGSAIVFERTVGQEIYEFGVSGKLWQTNMLMYDRATETLWSQIEGRAVVGDLLDSELKLYPSQMLSYKEAIDVAPNLQVLSNKTGYQRDYSVYPYGNYEQTEQLYFPINHPDNRLPAKTLMIASTVAGEAVAFHRENLLSAKVVTLETSSGLITARVSDNSEIYLTDQSGK